MLLKCYSKFSLLNWMYQVSFIHFSEPAPAVELCCLSYILRGTLKHLELLFHSGRPSLGFLVFPLLCVLTFPLVGQHSLLCPCYHQNACLRGILRVWLRTTLIAFVLSYPTAVTCTVHQKQSPGGHFCLRVCKFQR